MCTRVAAIILIAAIVSGCQPAGKTTAIKQQYQTAVAHTYLPLAMQEYLRGEYAAAAQTAMKVIEAEPRCAQAHLVYASAVLALGEYTEADAHFHIASTIDSSLSEAWLGRSFSAKEMGSHPAAIYFAKNAIQANPSNTEAIVHLAELHLASGENKEALALFERLPDDADIRLVKAAAATYLHLGKANEAVRLYERLSQANPGDALLAKTLGYAYIEAGRYLDAATVFEMLCKGGPDAVMTYLPKAVLYYIRAGRPQQAVLLCNKYVTTGRHDHRFWIAMSQATLAMNDATRAFYAARRATTLAPLDPQARILLGCALYSSGRYEDALSEFHRVTKRDNPFVWIMTGRCYAKLGRRDDAIQAFGRALAIDPANQTARRLTNQLASASGSAGTGSIAD
ncbi:MAG TPA: tetratricopeptide repeat protein, partial [Sedimentisphaerales bacterium]|nr:tetratricopeptide repeat protein [Sedimentisphaerales bacterium]